MKTLKEKLVERLNTKKVLRSFTVKVGALGFSRARTKDIWTRDSGHIIEFIHVHKYTFGPYFRIHSCIRVVNSPLDFIALFGPTEKELAWEENWHNKFVFEDNGDSINECSENMFVYIKDVAEEWFTEFRDVERLQTEGSPIFGNECVADLIEAVKNGPNEANVKVTRKLFRN